MNRRQQPAIPAVVIAGVAMYGLDAAIREGINRYRRHHQPWLLLDALHNLEYFDQALGRNPLGVIGHVSTPEFARRLRRTRLPVVDLAGLDHPGFARVRYDRDAAVKMGVVYLKERGFTRLACLTYEGQPWEAAIWEAVREQAAAKGLDTVWIQLNVKRAGRAGGPAGKGGWVEAVTPPTAVIAATERVGARFVEECRLAGLDVPIDVAVLCLGNNELMCQSGLVDLSGIDLNGEEIGYQAARVLADLIHARHPGDLPVSVRPTHIVTRHSTDVTAVSDPAVAAAMRFIADHAAEPINVASVIEAVRMDRRSLARRFQASVGRTVLEEIYRIRIQKAKRQLIETDAKLLQIAATCGFRDMEHLITRFRTATGMTPGVFRDQHRTT